MYLLAGIWSTIRFWDQSILFQINQVWSNGPFDVIMPWLRESAIWLPLYLFFIGFVLVNFGKTGLWWIVFFILTVSLCDQTGGWFKNYFQRPRPCNDPFMIEYVKLRLAYCSPSYSFVSNHAANHFGIAVFINRSLKNVAGVKTNWLYLWAAAICYAQMYVGIHYPTDILAGMLLGIILGNTVAWLFNKRFMFYFPAQANLA